MINEQDKQRIEKEAEVYTVSVESRGYSFWQGMYRGYVAGATAELERSEKLLQEYREVIRELLPIAEERLRRIVNYDMPDYHKVTGGIKSTIEKAKSLLHQPNRA